jgi:hypothetical protein
MKNILVSYYFLVYFMILWVWLKAFIDDKKMPNNDLKSWATLIIVTSLWPILLPFAYLEIVTRKLAQ